MINNDYESQIQSFYNYFKINEKKKESFKLGVEFEHFILCADTCEAIDYYGDTGVNNTLYELLKKGWEGKEIDGYLLELKKKDMIITLEPGAQIEVSISPQRKIVNIEKIYLEFLKDIIPILEKKNQKLVTLGYQPITDIGNIPFIPKERYKYMSEYLLNKGKYAHDMMKGTASIQISIDYSSEEDFINKFRLSNLLSPILSMIFDNSPLYKGKLYNKNLLRTNIWNNCDKDRSMVVKNSLDKEFGYRDYAEYILNNPPIIINRDNEYIYTKNKLTRDVFNSNEFNKEEIEHILTMFFPDVRLKGFIEIRMMDSIPYPLNLSSIALIKGIMYSDKNISKLLNLFKDFNNDDVIRIKKDIIENGFDTNILGEKLHNLSKYILDIAYTGLEKSEKEYLDPIYEMINNVENPSKLIKKSIPNDKRYITKNILDYIPQETNYMKSSTK